MNPQDFTEDAPGELVRNADGHWAFSPRDLPGPIEYTPDLVADLVDAEHALGRLVGKAADLPDPQIVTRSFVRREAQLSSRIENTYARYAELAMADQEAELEERTPSLREVRNNERALTFALTAVREQGRPVSLSLLREMHAMLMVGVRGEEQRPGQFRRVQAYIGRSHDIRDAAFVPPPHYLVNDAMESLERFIRQPDRTPALLRSAMIHYQFETIHPFADGNGRTGRALILLLLCEEGKLPLPVLNPSLYMEHNRGDYYQGLREVSLKGDWGGWYRYYLRGIENSAKDAMERIEKITGLRAEYQTLLQRTRNSALLLRLVDHLFASPATSVTRAAELLEVDYTTASRHVARLVDAGILEEVTGRARDRVYLAKPVIAAIEGDDDGAATGG